MYIHIRIHLCTSVKNNQIHQPYHSTYVPNNRAATCLDCERAPGDPPQGRYRAPSGHGRDQFSGENPGNPGEFLTVKLMENTDDHEKWKSWIFQNHHVAIDFDDFPTSGSSS